MEPKVLLVIAKKNFSETEFQHVYDVLKEHGFHLTIASEQRGTCYGKEEKIIQAELALEEVNPLSFDAVIFIGGKGSTQFFHDEAAMHIAREMVQNDVVGAICMAPSILANAGILKDKKVTAFSTERDNLFRGGALFTGNEVEVDGNIVTGNGPAASRKFAETFAELLLSRGGESGQ